MNVLFIFPHYPEADKDSSLTKDIVNAFVNAGHNVYVLTLLEQRNGQATRFQAEANCQVLRVLVGNYFATTKLEKAISILTLPSKLVAAVKKYLTSVKMELIVAQAPFVASYKIITPLKKIFNCQAHLLMWDFFPQSAWDLGILRNKLIWQYLKRRERKMLAAYNQIWCMSDGGVNYVKQQHSHLHNIGVDKLYNGTAISARPSVNKHQIRQKYGYTPEDVIAVFGGNMGIPQGLNNILVLAQAAQKLAKAKFLFIGTGTEKKRLIALAKQLNLTNVNFVSSIPRQEYEELLLAVDIGIVSLDQRFTIPNFPSKTIDYFRLGIPILASLDPCAAADYGDFIMNKVEAGLFALAGNANDLFVAYQRLYANQALRLQLGNNGYQFCLKELDVKLTCDKICGTTQLIA